jgi:hypothetical protein
MLLFRKFKEKIEPWNLKEEHTPRSLVNTIGPIQVGSFPVYFNYNYNKITWILVVLYTRNNFFSLPINLQYFDLPYEKNYSLPLHIQVIFTFRFIRLKSKNLFIYETRENIYLLQCRLQVQCILLMMMSMLVNEGVSLWSCWKILVWYYWKSFLLAPQSSRLIYMVCMVLLSIYWYT